jgi:hypothetical protein
VCFTNRPKTLSEAPPTGPWREKSENAVDQDGSESKGVATAGQCGPTASLGGTISARERSTAGGASLVDLEPVKKSAGAKGNKDPILFGTVCDNSLSLCHAAG